MMWTRGMQKDTTADVGVVVQSLEREDNLKPDSMNAGQSKDLRKDML